MAYDKGKKAETETVLKPKLLNPKQEMFCVLYASDREFFGNGVQSYVEAYNPPRRGNWMASARTDASRLLTNANILRRIDELLDIQVNNSFIDKRLGFWATQLAHPQASIEAIKEYNKLKKRIDEKLTLKFSDLTDDQLVEQRRRIVERLVANRQGNRKKKE